MKFLTLFFIFFCISIGAQDLAKMSVFEIKKDKAQRYKLEGVFRQKNNSVKMAQIVDIRKSFNPECICERVVFDFKTSLPKEIYLVLSAKHKRIFMDLMATNTDKYFNPFAKSKKVTDIKYYKLDSEKLSVEMGLKDQSKIEVFTLDNPSRLVIDIK